MAEPLISVVIPTRDRSEYLRQTLHSLDRQAAIPGTFEVIVADDGSTDDTRELLAGAEAFRFALRSVRLTPGGPGRARNRAIALAGGARVLLLGDDTPARTDLLSQHLEGAAGREIGVQGRLEWDPAAPITPVMRFLAPEGPQFYFKGLRHGQPIPYTAYYASNFSAPRQWFLEDPFDEGFTTAAFEDTELAYRWTRKGREAIYWETAVCAHRHHYPRIGSFLAKQREAGRAARRAARLHPGMAARTILQPLAVGLWLAARCGLTHFPGRVPESQLWDLRCRTAFLKGLLARPRRTS